MRLADEARAGVEQRLRRPAPSRVLMPDIASMMRRAGAGRIARDVEQVLRREGQARRAARRPRSATATAG